MTFAGELAPVGCQQWSNDCLVRIKLQVFLQHTEVTPHDHNSSFKSCTQGHKASEYLIFYIMVLQGATASPVLSYHCKGDKDVLEMCCCIKNTGLLATWHCEQLAWSTNMGSKYLEAQHREVQHVADRWLKQINSTSFDMEIAILAKYIIFKCRSKGYEKRSWHNDRELGRWP